MQPVTVSIDVPQSREDVFAFLDVLANHEGFTDHLMVDWKLSGPDRGVGAKASARTKLGKPEDVDFEVVSADPPREIVERNVGAKGRRVATGTYTLGDLPDGGTHIEFTYAWETAPRSERALAPVVRAILRRGNAKAMERLKETLSAR
jgi:Polyketide cyclase / dehydrase and lipid transport